MGLSQWGCTQCVQSGRRPPQRCLQQRVQASTCQTPCDYLLLLRVGLKYVETRNMGGCSSNIVLGESRLSLLCACACVCFSFSLSLSFSFPHRLAHVVCGFLEQEKLKAKPRIFFFFFFYCFAHWN